MKDYQIASQLRSAFQAARGNNTGVMEARTEAVREASYTLDLGHVAFLVREACALVERVPFSQNPAASLERAQAAIDSIEVELRAKGIETQEYDVNGASACRSVVERRRNLH